MSTTTSTTASTTSPARGPGERRLPSSHLLIGAAISLAVSIGLLAFVEYGLPQLTGGEGSNALTVLSVVVVGFLLHLVLTYTYSRVREGRRWARDRVMLILMVAAFLVTMFPLLSLLWSVLARGGARVIAAKPTPFSFWTTDMQGVIGGADAGGVLHAIIGTVLITLFASIISIPVGLFTAIFLVEYSQTGWRRTLSRGVTFLVDVMTGIPSIVAGLFGLALFIAFLPDDQSGTRMGVMGAVALSLLMIPTVVRNSEEMLRLVPMDLREASYALGVPKWLTIVRVVLRTAIAGLTSGVTLAIARVIGETAPLLLTVGMVTGVNWNMFDGRMATLPTFINQQYDNGDAVCRNDTVENVITGELYDCAVSTNMDRAWAAALTLIIIVMLLNLFARLVSYYFSPKLSR